MHVIGSQVWLTDADVAALRVLLCDDSFEEFAVSVEQLQQMVDVAKVRMQQPGQERIAVAMFDVAEQLQAVGVCL